MPSRISDPSLVLLSRSPSEARPTALRPDQHTQPRPPAILRPSFGLARRQWLTSRRARPSSRRRPGATTSMRLSRVGRPRNCDQPLAGPRPVAWRPRPILFSIDLLLPPGPGVLRPSLVFLCPRPHFCEAARRMTSFLFCPGRYPSRLMRGPKGFTIMCPT